MNILITGGTGFVGSELTRFLLKEGNSITILSRNDHELPRIRFIKSLQEIEVDEKIDVIINLAGEPINKRWSDSYKKILIDSRVGTTKDVINLIESLKVKPELLISGSAIGYYGSRNDEYIDEQSKYKKDFSHKLCNLWESEARKAEKLGVRTCITRLGVVLGENGGALDEMLPIFKLGMGGKIGSGKQFFSWVHINDVISVFDFLIQNKKQDGVYNVTSPSPTTNYKFTKILGDIINRITIFPVPGFVVKIIFGEMGRQLLLNGAGVYPKKLLNNGYQFEFDNIELALEDILNK